LRPSKRQWQTSRGAAIASSGEFEIAETATFQKHVESRSFRRYYQKILESVYPRLRSNPYSGPNIKRLKGELKSIFRYRIGDYRLFYTIDPETRRVYILEFANRKDAYRE
jgi:mRNA interferase RelE/StbE